jgi:hypothetical protein
MNRLLLTLLLLLVGSPALAAASKPADLNILFVGNSLTYVNNLPALFNALAIAQNAAPAMHADLIAAPGGSIAERWSDGITATEIASGRWQVLVLQERGGLLACLALPERRGEADCTASLAAHRKFSALAKEHGMRVILLGTWGPDSIWQGQLSRGLRVLADSANADAFDAGPLVRAYAKAHPQTPMYSDEILHPTLDTSLLVAAGLYRRITGQVPVAAELEISAALLPARANVSGSILYSRQPQLAGDGATIHIGTARLQPLFAAIAASRDKPRND